MTPFGPGDEIAGYRLEHRLGEGGMGVVYAATQMSLDRRVALKLVSPAYSGDLAFRERFRREGLAQAALDHPHIVTVFEAGEADGTLFIAMRLVQGSSLKELIVAGELDAARTLRILGPVADALDSAHEAGLIHRDVKPHNILVGRRDHGFLADFGLTKTREGASLTRTGQFMGSLDYVAPEQIRGDHASPRSDVYAFGAVLFECLTGSVPFPRSSEAAVLYAHVSDPLPRVTDVRAELPADLDGVLAMALAKDPAARYATATELVQAAERALAGGPELGPPPARVPERAPEAEVATEVEGQALPEAPPPAAARRSVPVGLVAGLAIAILAVAAFVIGGRGTKSAGGATRTVEAGGLALTAPDAWRRSDNLAAVDGFALKDRLALESAQGDGTLQVGVLRGVVDGRTLLPATFARRAPQALIAVGLGELQAYRYDLGERTLYAAPTESSVIGAACTGARRTRRECEEILNSMRLREGKPGRLGPDPAYAKVLDAYVAGTAVKNDLIRARTPSRQAAALARLAGRHRRLAGRLGTDPPVGLEAVHARLRRAARAVASGYAAMAAAAGQRQKAAYGRARSATTRAQAQVAASLRELARIGYGRVS